MRDVQEPLPGLPGLATRSCALAPLLLPIPSAALAQRGLPRLVLTHQPSKDGQQGGGCNDLGGKGRAGARVEVVLDDGMRAVGQVVPLDLAPAAIAFVACGTISETHSEGR